MISFYHYVHFVTITYQLGVLLAITTYLHVNYSTTISTQHTTIHTTLYSNGLY